MFDHSPSFALENFEGPLELLLHLIQKDEMDVCDIVLKELTQQLLDSIEDFEELDTGAETLGLTATLLLLKSHKLLPKDELPLDEGYDRVEMIQQLIEYCRVRDTAKLLSQREEEQKAFYPRAAPPAPKRLGSGLEEVSLNELQTLLREVMARAKKKAPLTIKDEVWHVSEKISWFRENKKKFPFTTLFSEERCREELVVTFLALLELMKLGELQVVKENEEVYIISA